LLANNKWFNLFDNMKCDKKRSLCGVSSALDIIGDKWSLLIIRDIMFDNKHTYGDFLNSEEKIATNILADRLLLLEKVGILSKTEHPESKAKFFYNLTPKGLDLMPVLFEMMLWSEKYLEVSERVHLAAKAIKADKDGLIEKFRKKHDTK